MEIASGMRSDASLSIVINAHKAGRFTGAGTRRKLRSARVSRVGGRGSWGGAGAGKGAVADT
jgi:hypothetical protein